MRIPRWRNPLQTIDSADVCPTPRRGSGIRPVLRPDAEWLASGHLDAQPQMVTMLALIEN